MRVILTDGATGRGRGRNRCVMERRKENVRRTVTREAVYIEPDTGRVAGEKRRGSVGPRRLAPNGHAKPETGGTKPDWTPLDPDGRAPSKAAARVQIEIIP